MTKFERISTAFTNSSYLQGIWTLENDIERSFIQTVPDAYPEIIIPLNGKIISRDLNSQTILDQPSIIGQLNRSMFIEMPPFSKLISFKLYPWTLGAFTHGDSKSILNKVVSLEYFQPSIYKACKNFKEQFLAGKDIRAAIDSLLNIISHRLNYTEIPFLAIDISNKFEAIRLLDFSKTNSNIRYSKRYVEKLYSENVGISPAQFLKILRVKKITIELQKENETNIYCLSDQLGYYDTSHMYKDFKKIVTQSPSKHFSELNPLYESKSYLRQWDYC